MYGVYHGTPKTGKLVYPAFSEEEGFINNTTTIYADFHIIIVEKVQSISHYKHVLLEFSPCGFLLKSTR